VRELETEGVARLVHRVGTIAYHQSDNTADSWFVEAYTRWEALGDRKGMAGTLNNRGLFAVNGGDFDLAVRRFRAAQVINREIGNEAWEATNLHNIGFALDESGHPKEARPYIEQALEIVRRLGDVGTECSVLNTLARVVDDAGDPDGAEPIYQEGLELCMRIGHDAGVSTARLNLATIYIDRGELDRAEESLLESLRLKREIGDRGGLVNCIEAISSVEGRRGHTERSVRLAAAAARDRITHENPLTPIVAESRTTWREEIRAELGDDAFDREWAAGERRRIEDIVEELLR
jgi:tetratricopeptide (TPR) repeat protein